MTPSPQSESTPAHSSTQFDTVAQAAKGPAWGNFLKVAGVVSDGQWLPIFPRKVPDASRQRRLSGQSESWWHRKSNRSHLGQVGTFVSQQFFLLSLEFRMPFCFTCTTEKENSKVIEKVCELHGATRYVHIICAQG